MSKIKECNMNKLKKKLKK